MNAWDSYPVGSWGEGNRFDDDTYHRRLLLEQSSTLFVEDGVGAELDYVDGGTSQQESRNGLFMLRYCQDLFL